eukprot:4483746-Amphidinium_carterae.3
MAHNLCLSLTERQVRKANGRGLAGLHRNAWCCQRLRSLGELRVTSFVMSSGNSSGDLNGINWAALWTSAK